MIKKFRSLAILLLTVVLLFLVVRKVGLDELVQALTQADLMWVLFAVSLSPLIVFTGVIKWKILLKSQGVEIPLWRLYGLYLVGKFFNNFLPSNVGGDVVRGYELGRYTKDGAGAMASVFMERFTGFVVLIIMAVIAFITQINVINDIRLTLAMAFAVTGLVGVLWLIMDTRPLGLIERYIHFPLVEKVIPKFRKFHTSISAYRSQKRALALSLLWSLAFMLLAIANVYVCARAFHQSVPFLGVVVIVPIILVVSMVPLTINGLGIQEWAYVLLFTLIGLPAAIGLSTVILIRGKDYLLALIGGIIYPFFKISKESTQLPVEQNS